LIWGREALCHVHRSNRDLLLQGSGALWAGHPSYGGKKEFCLHPFDLKGRAKAFVKHDPFTHADAWVKRMGHQTVAWETPEP
jgi:hypothetical protein